MPDNIQIPYWKQTWRVLSGSNGHELVEVKEVLLSVKAKLLQGFVIYRPYNENGYKEYLAKINSNNKPELATFLLKLSKALNLDSHLAWLTFITYLNNEYYGKMNELEAHMNTTELMDNLVKAVWNFYTLERTYMIQIWHLILQECTTNHRYGQEYLTFALDISMKEIRKSFCNQIKYLINEITDETYRNCVDLNCWMDRNYHEQLRVLLALLTTIEYQPIDDIQELIDIFKIFKIHKFAHRPVLTTIVNTSQNMILQQIRDVEIGIFLVGIQEFLFNSEVWFHKVQEFEKLLHETTIDITGTSVLALCWGLLVFNVPLQVGGDNVFKYSNVYIAKAFKENALDDLNRLASNSFFEDTPAGVAVQTGIYHLLQVMCTKFDKDKLFLHEGVLALFAKMLRTKKICVMCFSDNFESPMYLMNQASALFPHEFYAFSSFAESLLQDKERFSDVARSLCNIFGYCELNQGRILLENDPEFLVEPYRPLNNDLIVFETGTLFEIITKYDQEYIVFNTSFSYFTMVNHAIKCLIDVVKSVKSYDPNVEKMVEMGLGVYIKILEKDFDFVENNESTNNLLSAVIDLIEITIKPLTRNLKLTKLCTRVLVEFFYHAPDQIIKYLISTELLMSSIITADSPNVRVNMRSSQFIELIQEDLKSNECHLFLTFVKLFDYSFQLNKFHSEIQIPSLTFMVFNLLNEYNDLFTSDPVKRTVAIKIINSIHKVVVHDEENPEQKEVYFSVMHPLAYNKEVFMNLMRIIGCGNNKMEKFLLTDIQWNQRKLNETFTAFDQTLRCIENVIMFHVKMKEINKDKFVEDTLYNWTPHHVSILRLITGYISNIYIDIKVSSVKILLAFAKLSEKPLLPSLELDNRQIQRVFVEPLYNNSEHASFKIVSLKFIEMCVKKQVSLTMAFFSNIEDDKSNTLLNYLRDFLSETQKDCDKYPIQLQTVILELIGSLWVKNNQNVIAKLISDDKFWTKLTAPMFNKTDVNVSVMVKIFNVLVLEMDRTKELSDNFKSHVLPIICKFVNFARICNERFASRDDDDHFADLQLLIRVWKKFLTAVSVNYPSYLKLQIRDGKLHTVLIKCLTNHTKTTKDIRIVVDLMEIYVLFTHLQEPSEIDVIYTEASAFINNIARIYRVVDSHFKTILLTMFLTIIRNSTSIISEDTYLVVHFLKQFWQIYEDEYEYVTGVPEESVKDKDFYTNMVIITGILNIFLEQGNEKAIRMIFTMNRYLQNCLDLLGVFERKKALELAKRQILNSLIIYANSKLASDFDSLNLEEFYAFILPSSENLLKHSTFPNGIIPSHLKQFWLTYSYLIRLNGILMRDRNGLVTHKILSFIYMHYEVICDILSSATVLADKSNLKVVLDLLHLIHGAIKHYKIWIAFHKESLVNVMDSMKAVLNASILVVLRPKILAFVPDVPETCDTSMQMNIKSDVAEENFVDVINSLIEIITWCCMNFLQLNPSFPLQINGCWSSFQLLLTCDFRVPPVLGENPKILSYGALLCALNYFCNTLTQMSNSSNIPMDTTKIEPSFNVLIYPNQTEQQSAVHRALQSFLIPETFGLQSSWSVRLNQNKLRLALEALNTLLAEQALLTLHDPSIDVEVKRYVRRELCAEFLNFYDFVYKQLQDKEATEVLERVTDRNCLFIDLEYTCKGRLSGKKIVVTSQHQQYLIVLTHWLRHICRLVHFSKYDEFLSQFHAKSTCLMEDSKYVKNINILDDEDQDEM